MVDDLAISLAWMAANGHVYCMASAPGGADCAGDGSSANGHRLEAVPKTGGEPRVLAEHQGSLDQLAVDPTGVYWAESLPCLPSAHAITKYTFATGSVSTFSSTTGIPHSVRAEGGRVLWIDEGGLDKT